MRAGDHEQIVNYDWPKWNTFLSEVTIVEKSIIDQDKIKII